MQLAIAFECQLEPPPSSSKNQFFNLKELSKSGLVVTPPPLLALQLLVIVFFRSTNILGISSKLRVLFFEKKNAYKPRGDERGRGEGRRIRAPIHIYLYEHLAGQTLREHDEVTLEHR